MSPFQEIAVLVRAGESACSCRFRALGAGVVGKLECEGWSRGAGRAAAPSWAPSWAKNRVFAHDVRGKQWKKHHIG